VGGRLGRYRVERRLGSGGMGDVYLAEDPELRRHVAIKVLPPNLASDPERVERFRREARALAALNHPSIVTIHSVEQADGLVFLTMELVDGTTLRDAIPAQGLVLTGILDLAIPLADALSAAHEKGVVHRDLKPGNLMRTRDGRVKILDFGLARMLPTADRDAGDLATESGGALTREGEVFGTVPYMAPEQLMGQPADARSDIFSFGVLLYEMATGVRPFQGESPAVVMSAILRDEPRPVSEVRPELPREFSRIVRRCIERNPDRRLQTAKELRNQLEELRRDVTSGAVQAAPPSVSNATARSSQVLGSLAILPLVNMSAEKDQEYFADGMTEALIADLARLGALRVTSRTSVMRYKGTGKSLPEIARELGVDGIVEGSVFRAGDRVRITVQLIDARTDSHLWAESYERELVNVLALQSGVAKAIAQEIRLRLSSKDLARFEISGSLAPAAYEAYLVGRHFLNQRTRPALEKSVEYFRRSIDEAPHYALAYAGMADALTLLGAVGYGVGARATVERARAAVTRALELDDGLAEAHASLGYLLFRLDWKWAEAEAEFRRAIELSPSLSSAHRSYAMYLGAMGRHDEARAEIGEALALDPLSVIVQGAAGRLLEFAGAYDEAIEHCRRAIALDADHAEAHFNLGMCLAQLSRFEEAVASLRRAADLSGERPLVLSALGYVYGRMGRMEEAEALRKRIEALSSTYPLARGALPFVDIGLGEHERAVAEIERHVAERYGPYVFLAVEPVTQVLRSLPRFQQVLARMSLSSAGPRR
jgi:eukaryotic-like serine/threonine-protein kinase